MQRFASRIEREVKVSRETSSKLATMIAAEVRFLSPEQKAEIKSASPIAVEDRLEELSAFQGWMDQAGNVPDNPSVVRAQVLTQNYVCFVYLPESCFRQLARVCLPGSVARRCAKFLCDNPVRAFRNAMAHANWTYRSDFGALVYWARLGNDPNEPLRRFEVEQEELEFWQALSRCVAYAAYSNL